MDECLSDHQIDAYIQACNAEYGLQFYYYALSLTNNAEDASDIVQDAFEEGYNHLRATRHPFESVLGWFYTVVRNRCYDLLRVRRRHITDSVEVLQVLGSQDPRALLHEVFVDTSEQPEVVVEHKLILEQVVREIQSLPPGGIRNALILCYKGVDSPKEIAALAGQTYSSARSNMSRGRKLLRTRLIPWIGEEQEA